VLEENFFVEQILPKGVLRALTDAEMTTTGAFCPRRGAPADAGVARETPIAGQPADVVAISEHYREALTRSTLPKLLFTAEPGILVTAPVVAWAREHLPTWRSCPSAPASTSCRRTIRTRSARSWPPGCAAEVACGRRRSGERRRHKQRERNHS